MLLEGVAGFRETDKYVPIRITTLRPPETHIHTVAELAGNILDIAPSELVELRVNARAGTQTLIPASGPCR